VPSSTDAELVGAELGHEFVGLTPLNLEDLFSTTERSITGEGRL